MNKLKFYGVKKKKTYVYRKINTLNNFCIQNRTRQKRIKLIAYKSQSFQTILYYNFLLTVLTV